MINWILKFVVCWDFIIAIILWAGFAGFVVWLSNKYGVDDD